MALRSPHGRAKNEGPRIETLPADELPAGIPVPLPGELPTDRDDKGRFTPENTLASTAGKAKEGKLHATRLGGVHAPAPLPAIRTYLENGKAFRRAHCKQLAYTVGGGVCGPAVSVLVAQAARATAWAQYYGDMADATGDMKAATQVLRFMEITKGHLAMAHELCAREALARSKVDTVSPHEQLVRALEDK